MGELSGKKILLIQQRSWGINVGHFLAKKLQAQGCILAALTLKRSAHNFIVGQQDVKYKFILNNDEVMARPKDYLKEDDFTLAEICESLGVDSIWPIVNSLRNHVHSYGEKYYYGYGQNVSDEGIIDFVKAVFKYVKYFVDEFKPDLILAPNFVALPHVMLNLYAQKNGIKMLAITDCKVKGVNIFSYGFNDDAGPFYDRVDQLNNRLDISLNEEKAASYIARFREEFIKPVYSDDPNKKLSFYKKIRHELSPYRLIIDWYIKPRINYLESTGISGDYRPPRIILRDHYCEKYNKWRTDHYRYFPFASIRKYVYFPLQFQPEATMDVVAPFFSNQVETARLAAMSLPDDYTLVVREHPAMVGLRRPEFHRMLDKTPNIKLIDYRIPSEQVLKNSSLVISPNGTTIVEAAFYRKPVIQLGNLGTTLKLPNVIKHTDLTTLSGKIKEALISDLNNEEYERKLRNFVAAAYDTGFDVNYLNIWAKGRGGDPEKLWQMYKNEIIRATEVKK